MTNMKSHTRFRLVPKSTTLDDLEGSLCTLFQNTCVFRNTTKKIWMKIDPYILSATKMCSPMTVVSGNTRFMRIFAGVPGEGASSDNGVIKNIDFRGFRSFGRTSFPPEEMKPIHCVRKKRVYSLLCVTLTNLKLFTHFCTNHPETPLY